MGDFFLLLVKDKVNKLGGFRRRFVHTSSQRQEKSADRDQALRRDQIQFGKPVWQVRIPAFDGPLHRLCSVCSSG
ncbi:hypothetical protein THTE_4100 [Thermogutta terrifontis]|uniref:Uncharacterized protein n=1 Tax=Thermogutta terrifontis TaxID=1331910 RepID=A0A286RL87_9BACT|nr:hypothetical protein THTE_4100 [Thermogutta terrifontis]